MNCFRFTLLIVTGWLMVSTAPAFEFKNQDRVVLLGGTLVEREQQFGYFETALQLGTPGKQITVRNLGWSGDTVFGHARSYFGPPSEGLERLAGHLEQLKPTVLIACYGADMPFEGLMKLPDFITGYRKLLDMARVKSPNLRVVIVAPPPFELKTKPLPDLTEANQELLSVRDALKEFAAKQNATFVDAYTLMSPLTLKKETGKQELTTNGLHYNEHGYRMFVTELLGALGLPKVDIQQPVAKEMRKVVVKKDFLFFNRWRPANETYLHGFRKHEQGQNAKEMEQFDPLVEAEEKKIAELKANAAKLP